MSILQSIDEWVELKISGVRLLLTYAEYKRALFRGKCRKRAQDRKLQQAELTEPFPKFE